MIKERETNIQKIVRQINKNANRKKDPHEKKRLTRRR